MQHYYGIPAAAATCGMLGTYALGVPNFDQMASLGASAACIGAIGGLSSQATARKGNVLGMLGVGTGKSRVSQMDRMLMPRI